MTLKRILLIRSGETDWNRAGKHQGWVASPLNAHGKRQAEKLARFLRNIGIGALYSSDLARAKQTTEILVSQLGLTPVYDERLRERSVGQWQGLTLGEIRDWYPQEYAALNAHDSYRVPSGESRADVQARFQLALKDIMKQTQAETIGIVSHTTAIKLAVALLVPQANAAFEDLNNTSVTTLAYDETGMWQVMAMDDVLHLEGMESQAMHELEDK
jgi:2,3-bisphosphoglycerate-dependent phosphoglycerate mutase